MIGESADHSLVAARSRPEYWRRRLQPEPQHRALLESFRESSVDRWTTWVGLKNASGPVYAWDAWLLYGPEANGTDAGPPPAELLMHQLGALRGTPFPRFDGQVFAERVRQLLAQLAPVATGQRRINCR